MAGGGTEEGTNGGGRPGFLTLEDGVRLETAWWGPGPADAPTLILLHEGLGSITQWRGLPETLARQTGFGVFAYARRGYGRSTACALPRPIDYLHEEGRRVLPGVIAAAGIGAHVLVGHSDGASIATIHAGSAATPGLRGLVVMSPHYFVEDMCLVEIAKADKAFREGDLRRRLSKHHDDVDAAFRGWNDVWLNPDFRALDLTDCLEGIAVPMLQIQGIEDPYGTPAQTAMAERLVRSPLSTLLLPAPARHSPHIEAPEPTVPAIAGFAAAHLGG